METVHEIILKPDLRNARTPNYDHQNGIIGFDTSRHASLACLEAVSMTSSCLDSHFRDDLSPVSKLFHEQFPL